MPSDEELREQYPFFFQAMLMYAWVADERYKVRRLNKSLANLLTKLRLDDLNHDVRERGVELNEFFSRLFTEEDGSKDTKHLSWVGREIQNLLEKLAIGIAEDPVRAQKELQDTRIGDYTFRPVLQLLDEVWLGAVRVVRAGGIRLTNGTEEQRVDLINICKVEKVKDWPRPRYQVTGFQGQLQDAWLQVEPVIRQGTKSGSTALAVRNLSHNFGSHAIYYLEQEAEESNRDQERRFYRYLRERMEMLATFATEMPMASTTTQVSSLVADLRNNTLLLDRIARTEGIETIDIRESHEDRLIALPGGILGAHAFYAIVENIIRDSAKHGRPRTQRSERASSKPLVISIRVGNPSGHTHADGYVEVEISDKRQNYATASPNIRSLLEDLRISDYVGRLRSGGWGVKERYIFAAFLRGLRVEDLAIGKCDDENINLNLARQAPDGLKILDIRDCGGNLGWVFYLLIPRDILFVHD